MIQKDFIFSEIKMLRSLLKRLGLAALLAIGAQPVLTQIDCLTSGSPAFAQGAPVVIEKLVIPAGFYVFKIPKIEFSGTTLNKAEIMAIFDVKSKVPLKDRLTKFTFRDAVAPELVIETNLAGDTTRTVYRNAKLSDVVAGKIGRFSADGASFSAKNIGKDTSIAMNGDYGALVAEGVDIPAINRIISETSQDANAPMETLYASYTIAGMKVEGQLPDGKMLFSMGKVSGGNFRGRPGKLPLFDFIEILKDNPDPDDMDDEDVQKLVTSLIQMFRNIEFGHLEMSDFSMEIQPKEAGKKAGAGSAKQPVKPVEFKIASMKFGQPDTSFRMEGLQMEVPSEKVLLKLGSYEFKGYSLTPTLDAVQKLLDEGNIKELDPSKLDVRDFMPVLGTSMTSGLEMQAPDKKGDFGGPIKMGIASTKTEFGNQVRGIPTSIRYAIRNLTIDLPESSTDKGVLEMKAMGIEKLDVSFVLDAKWDEATKEFKISELSLNGEKFGVVRFSGSIGNIPKEMFSGSLSTAQILMLALTAKNAEISFENKGFLAAVDKGIKKGAEDAGQTEAEFRQKGLDSMKAELVSKLGEGPVVDQIVSAIKTFSNGGKSLSISVKAKNDLGVGAMDFIASENPKELLAKVDIQVKAE